MGTSSVGKAGHAKAWQKANKLLLVEGKRQCTHCLKIKLLDQFKRYTSSDHYRSRCRTCDSAVARENNFRVKFEISIEFYDLLLIRQNGVCLICKVFAEEGKRRFHVDHDHESGKIRGLLCQTCNLGLGNFKDDVLLLEAAIHYLERD